MSVYVDQLQRSRTRWASACHMYADTDEELESMAGKICMHPDWRHGDHYDLTTSRRIAAVSLGAIEMTARKLASLRKARKHKSRDSS